jgi:hypothetical protein
MARYDSQGYRSDGRRQILGYSRQAQGGADQARARAEQRAAEGWNPSLRNARRRRERVDEAKEDGTFNETRDTYNEEGEAAGVEMDNSGNIRQKPKPILAAKTEYTPKKPARSTPLSYARPASQRLADAVDEASGMASPGGLAEIARKARVRRTKVAR